MSLSSLLLCKLGSETQPGVFGAEIGEPQMCSPERKFYQSRSPRKGVSKAEVPLYYLYGIMIVHGSKTTPFPGTVVLQTYQL